MKNLIYIFIALFILGSSAYAATYYVATTGNDSYTTTQAQNSGTPWKTIGKAEANAVAGDIVKVSAGTYTENITFDGSGSSGSKITFNVNGGGSPVIVGNVNITGTHITLDGFTVSPVSGAGILLNGQYITVQNCTVTDMGACAGEQTIAMGFDGAYNTVDGCTIKDLNDIDAFHVFGHDHVIRNTYATHEHDYYQK